MNILLVSSGTNNHDGWSTYAKILEKALELESHSVTHYKVTTPLSYLTNPFVAPLKAWRLLSEIRNKKPDVIHITVEPLAMMLAFLPKKITKKCVLTVHGSYGVRMFQGRNAKRSDKILERIGAVITVSQYTKKRLLEETGGLPNVHVVHNAIELPENNEHKPNDTKQIICVGGIKPRKGITEALSGLAQYIKTKGTDVHFTIIGAYKKDAYYEQVQNMIYAHSLNEYVTITGVLSDNELKEYFQKADLFLMPAKTTADTFEGFGLVYIEANAYGVPCIGPNDSGAMEAIEEGVTGYSVDPNDPEAIADAMYKILEKNAISADQCKAWAKRFSLSELAVKIEAVYNSL